jgi:hypothetical protein
MGLPCGIRQEHYKPDKGPGFHAANAFVCFSLWDTQKDSHILKFMLCMLHT